MFPASFRDFRRFAICPSAVFGAFAASRFAPRLFSELSPLRDLFLGSFWGFRCIAICPSALFETFAARRVILRNILPFKERSNLNKAYQAIVKRVNSFTAVINKFELSLNRKPRVKPLRYYRGEGEYGKTIRG